MSEAYAYDDEIEEAANEDVLAADPSYLAQAPMIANLAFDIPDDVLGQIGAKTVEEFDIDLASRKAVQFDDRIERALRLASLAAEAKNTPWENASNVKYPLIIEAAIQFNARSYAAVVDGSNIVKGRVLGSDAGSPDGELPGAKAERATRISRHMSWQLLEEIEEWEDDTDALLLRLAIVGTLVRKTYFDPAKGRICSHVIGPDQFVVNYHAKRDLSVVPRATHVLEFYPHEVVEKQRAGLWRDVDLGRPGDQNDDQAPHEFLEQHRLWDLDDDGYPEPYIVTVHRETRQVVRIAARWYQDGVKLNERGEVAAIEPYRVFTKYGFIPAPDGGFYDMGFGTLLGPLSDTINTSINQLMDAATLANLQGGFIGEGVSIKSGSQRFKPGEWKKAATAGGNLAQNIVPLPTKEPSAVLFSLMQFLIEAAKSLTATQDILTGDSGSANTPVGTTLALIEQGLKTFTAIVKRIHRALKRELGIIYGLNARYLDPEVYFSWQDEEGTVAQDDYRRNDVGVVPVSDPSMATDMQKLGRAQFLMGMRGAGLNDMEINKRVLEAASVPDADKLIPQEPPGPPPQLMVEMRKLDLEERRFEIEEGRAAADIASKNAATEQTKLETFMAGPEMAAIIAGAVQSGIAQAMEMLNGDGSPDVRPGELPGMGGPSTDGPLPPVPGGSGGGPESPMGGGPGAGPPSPDQSAALFGVGEPGLG